MRGKIVWLLLALSLLAGCSHRALLGGTKVSVEHPGTSISYNNPNPQKWTRVLTPSRLHPTVSIFACKPLACAGAAAVSIRVTRSPTRHPDHTALEKAAKLLLTQTKAQDLMMDAASDGDERISPVSSKVTEIRGYPAILAETRRTSRGKTRHMLSGHLFIGLQLVQISALATTSAQARRYFDEFVTGLAIVDVEPGAPNVPSATEPPEPGDNAGPAAVPSKESAQ